MLLINLPHKSAVRCLPHRVWYHTISTVPALRNLSLVIMHWVLFIAAVYVFDFPKKSEWLQHRQHEMCLARSLFCSARWDMLQKMWDGMHIWDNGILGAYMESDNIFDCTIYKYASRRLRSLSSTCLIYWKAVWCTMIVCLWPSDVILCNLSSLCCIFLIYIQSCMNHCRSQIFHTRSTLAR